MLVNLVLIQANVYFYHTYDIFQRYVSPAKLRDIKKREDTNKEGDDLKGGGGTKT